MAKVETDNDVYQKEANMKFLVNVEKERFDTFNRNHPHNHYTKMSSYGVFRQDKNTGFTCLGVEDDNQVLLGTALLIIMHVPLIGKLFYVPSGPNLDPSNMEIQRFFYQELKALAKKEKCFMIKVDPNIERLEHYKDGTTNPDGFNNEHYIDFFKEFEYHHTGFKYGYSGYWRNRFTYVLDLSDDLKTIQSNIKRYNTYHEKNVSRYVHVIKSDQQDLHVLVNSQKSLSKKRVFVPKQVAHFKKLMNSFKDNATLYVATVDYPKAYANLSQQKEELYEKLKQDIKESKKNQFTKQIASLEKELIDIKKLADEHPEVIKVGAKLIVQIGPKVFNIYMYTQPLLNNMRVAFALHDKAIMDAKENGVSEYNFEGVSGSLDPEDIYYGMYVFKKSFGGDFIEYLGEFDCVLKPGSYDLYVRKLPKFKRAIRYVRRKLIKAKN